MAYITDYSRATQFKPGQSGNPKGAGVHRQSEEQREMQALARQYSINAVKRVSELMQSSDERVVLKAADMILDRAFGTPSQSIHLSETEGVTLTELPPSVKRLDKASRLQLSSLIDKAKGIAEEHAEPKKAKVVKIRKKPNGK